MAEDTLRAVVERGLPPGWRGRFLGAVGSTQDVAREAGRAGEGSRYLVVADHQTAGRGRHGRRWLAPPGTGLLCSALFREAPRGASPRPWRFTALASTALAEAVEWVVPSTRAEAASARPGAAGGVRLAIKWPNDLLLDGAKVAGVLAESTWDGRDLAVVVGVGLNVRVGAADLAPVGPSATSLRLATGADVDRGSLLLAFLARVDAWLAAPPEHLFDAWSARLWGVGQPLRLAEGGLVQQVVVLGVDADGALRVRLPDGGERRTTTGELLP